MLNYCKEMSCLLSNISVQVKAEGCREGYVGARKPLQEGAAHCGGRAIAGGGSARVSINAKIQFEKPLHCSCVFKRNRHTGGHRNQQNR